MIKLEHAMMYRLDVSGPLEATDGSQSNPRRQWWQMTRATLDGPDIHAVSAMPGIDWFTPYPNGYGRPHVRLPFHTSDGALILLEYQGIVHASDVFVRAVERDTSTQWDDQCMRMALIFDTTADRYAWLDELHEAWNSCGARIVSKPESKPWHLHEFTATDEDGNLLRVFYDFAWELPDRGGRQG